MLKDRFNSAVAYMSSRKDLKLPNPTKLALYADYKLATEGLCTQPRPSLLEFEKSAKWKAWKETGDTYSQELSSTTTTSEETDTAEFNISTKAMIAYIQKVEEGQWGWVFDPSTIADPSSTLAAVLPTGDSDLDELQAYLGVDKEEISAEELLARPYVPHENTQFDPSTMTAAGISTMAMPAEEEGEDALEAAKSGSVEALQKTLSANPELGMTMLHWACDRGSLKKVKLLVETYNVDVNALDDEGSTPLHYACLSGWPELATYLQSLPAVDQSIKDHSGMTAAEYLD
ncbi:ankyrin [Linnemannia elongata AG-77]|uniref:Ankyrin n=1 Tax=Linnemannia elongata AG-77 TaxID=1314771 RepID=A0A197JVJ8_9FUNG|nr:ankyrin [Linnemannia elongata AG-77]